MASHPRKSRPYVHAAGVVSATLIWIGEVPPSFTVTMAPAAAPAGPGLRPIERVLPVRVSFTALLLALAV